MMTALACRMSIAAARVISASLPSSSPSPRLINGLSTPLSLALSPASRRHSPLRLSVPVRTLLSLPRTFPEKSRSFLARQEAWRKRDGVPNHSKVELIYLMPTYKKILVRTLDLVSIPFGAVWLIAIPVLFIRRRFFPDDDEVDDVKGKADENDDADVKYEVDEKGRVWKQRPLKIQSELKPPTGWLLYFLMAMGVFVGCAARVDMARRPLRIYFDPMVSHYHAVFSRHWRPNRVETFNERRVNCRRKRFFIHMADGNHLVLPGVAKRRHFRADDHHADVFLKPRHHPLFDHDI